MLQINGHLGGLARAYHIHRVWNQDVLWFGSLGLGVGLLEVAVMAAAVRFWLLFHDFAFFAV